MTVESEARFGSVAPTEPMYGRPVLARATIVG